jgi:hypothetical protein
MDFVIVFTYLHVAFPAWRRAFTRLTLLDGYAQDYVAGQEPICAEA